MQIGSSARFLTGTFVLVAIAGCADIPFPAVHPIGRNRVSDFFAKDFELPDYRPDEDRLARERHRIRPSSTAAAMGDAAAAYAGGYGNAWRTSSAAALGDLGGAGTAAALTNATHEEPLPKDYTGLEIAFPFGIYDPNAGLTVGILPVSIFRERDRITNIFAPQITYNQIDGFGAIFRIRRPFTTTSNLEVDAGSTTNGAHTYDLRYKQAQLGPFNAMFVRMRARYTTDLTARFWGLGNDTDFDDQTSYTFRRTQGELGLGLNLPAHFRFEFTELLTSNSVGPGKAKGLPSAKKTFPNVPGMQERVDLLSHRITLTLDTRDFPNATTEGVFAEVYLEIGDATLGSDVSFQRGGFTLSAVYSYYEKRFATAARIAGRFVGGSSNLPFYEQTSVGGKTSLRGFNDGRFVDKHGVVAGLEERWNVFGFRLYDVEMLIQVAAFIECGYVFRGGDPKSLARLHPAGGGALRLILPASDLVASGDFGFSNEGTQAFIDLGYPF